MFRSPIFIILLLLLYSCNDSSKTANIRHSKNKNTVQARKFLEKGISHYANQKMDSAFYYYNRSKMLYESEKDTVGIVYNLIQMANIQQISGDYFGSEKSALESLTYASKNSIYDAAAYNLLGISSKALTNYDEALYYYDKAKLTTKDTLPRISIENNKASVYIQKKEFAASIKILEPILKSTAFDTVFVTKSRVIDNLGYCYYKVNRNQEGLDLMIEALAIRKRINDSFGIIGSNLHLSEYFLKSDPLKAKEYALKAYQTAMSIHSPDERLESLSFLVDNDFEKGNHNYAVLYIQLNDSIIKVRNNAKNQFAKIKYDTDQNRTENLKLKAQESERNLKLAYSENQKLVLLLFVIVGTGITFLRLNHVKLKSKKEKLLEIYNTETRISKQLHDELANDVYHTMAFAETQDLSSSSNKEILLRSLDTIYSRTRNISKENSSIDTGPNFVIHLKDMLSHYKTDEVNVIVNGLNVLNIAALESNKKVIIYRAIQELLVNMKKHSRCTVVAITFKKTDKQIQIDYSDNGIGAGLDKINLKNGLGNMENRIRAIKGTVTFDSELNKGFKISIKFPI